MIFTNKTADSSYISTQPDNVEPLATKTVSDIATGIAEISKVEVVVYFTDASGNEEVCAVSNPLEF